MRIVDLFNLQGTLFIMILAGVALKRFHIIDDAGKRCLSDICINIIIPCNTIRSFLIPLDPSIVKAGSLLLGIGIVLQLSYVFYNRFLFNRYDPQQKKVLKYCTMVSNGGFLGNPIAEGVYGNLGLLYASLFLIPMRIVAWSVGTAYFVGGAKTDKKAVFKNVLTHPCLLAVYIGLFLMITQIKLPGMVVTAMTNMGSCTATLTMFIIGTILADVNVMTIVNKTTLSFSALRLIILPAIALLACSIVGLNRTATGVAVMLTGMPAGSTAAIFAARYDSDAPFATKCVVLTTLLSMVTIPIWCYVVG